MREMKTNLLYRKTPKAASSWRSIIKTINNLTRINWLNTRLIIASYKIRHEIPFEKKTLLKTNDKRCQMHSDLKGIYKNSLWKQAIFFYYVSLLNFLFLPHSWIPPSTILIFPSIFYSLLHNFNIFPQFYYFPSSSSFYYIYFTIYFHT